MGFNSAFKGLIQVVFYRKMQYSPGLSFADVCAVEVYSRCTEGQAERTGLNCGKEVIWCDILCSVTYVATAGVRAVQSHSVINWRADVFSAASSVSYTRSKGWCVFEIPPDTQSRVLTEN